MGRGRNHKDSHKCTGVMYYKRLFSFLVKEKKNFIINIPLINKSEIEKFVFNLTFMCIFSFHMYSLFGYYYHPLAEYLKGKTNIRKEKALPRGSSRRWVQEGGWPTRHQARQVSGSRLCAGRPCSSPPTPTAHQFNSPRPPYAKRTGIAHEEECPQGGLSGTVRHVHVAHKCGLAGLLPSGIHIFNHLVIHSLFTGEEQIKQIFTILEPFWPAFVSLISVQYM